MVYPDLTSLESSTSIDVRCLKIYNKKKGKINNFAIHLLQWRECDKEKGEIWRRVHKLHIT